MNQVSSSSQAPQALFATLSPIRIDPRVLHQITCLTCYRMSDNCNVEIMHTNHEEYKIFVERLREV